MNKIQSLEFLKENEFNVMPFRVVSTPNQWADFKNIYIESAPGTLFSGRTQPKGIPTDKSFQLPFGRGFTFQELEKFVEQNMVHYDILVYQSLDPEDCIVKGNIAMMGEEVWVEFLEGPGIVRDLEHTTPKNFKIEIGAGIPTDDPQISQILREVYSAFLKITDALAFQHLLRNNVVVEWGYYKEPVGFLSQNLIFWEVR
jgi:hypothetical protein